MKRSRSTTLALDCLNSVFGDCGDVMSKFAKLSDEFTSECRVQKDSLTDYWSDFQSVSVTASRDTSEFGISAIQDFVRSNDFWNEIIEMGSDDLVSWSRYISSSVHDTNTVHTCTQQHHHDKLRDMKQLSLESTPSSLAYKDSGVHITDADSLYIPKENYIQNWDELPIVVTESEAPFNITYVNKAWEELCHYTSDQVIGKSLAIIQGQDTDKTAFHNLLDDLQEKHLFETELINYTKDQIAFKNHVKIFPASIDNLNVTHFVGILQDMGNPYSAVLC